jgi:hypothetical protein
MNATVLALAYWVAVAAIGFAAATASWLLGRSFNGKVVKVHPELMGAARAELIRDWLLMVGLGLNFTVGVLAVFGSIRTPAKLSVILAGATAVSAFAVYNLWMRTQ